MSITATRYHDISVGHRVHNHESKCKHLHGHNYRIHFTCEAADDIPALDSIGRVIDFGEIKSKLCMWLEENWDHKFVLWYEDPLGEILANAAPGEPSKSNERQVFLNLVESLVFVPFNPTAENMAIHLVEVIGPQQLIDTGIVLVEVKIEETAKCHASYSIRR